MKNILHFQIPFKNKKTKDNFAVTPELLGGFMKLAQERIGDEFIVISSPFVPSLLSEDSKVINFDMTQIGLRELREMIKDDKK